MKTHVTALLCTTKKFLILNRYTQCGEVTLKIKRKEEEEKNFQTGHASSLGYVSISNQIKKVDTKFLLYRSVNILQSTYTKFALLSRLIKVPPRFSTF